jgi:hypothetical protein
MASITSSFRSSEFNMVSEPSSVTPNSSMALPSSSNNGGLNMLPMTAQPVSEKLMKLNHPTWRAQVLAVIRGARLEGFLTGKTEAPAVEIVSKDNDGKTIKTLNPAHESWLAQDQQVLNFLLSSLSKEIISSAASKSTAALAWKEIEGMFSSQTRARVVNTRMTLANTKKGNTSTADVFQKFHEFQNLVERMFNRKIIAIQNDWGGEYEKLNSFFTKIDISHQVSCPHTHQQNGSVECKHRHIVEVGLSLLARASMPLKFWDEAFLAASFLINRTPSKVINFQTPIERLFSVKPHYSSLRIFGCACWSNLRPYNQHKLEFRSKECVFLGYSNMHKGFKT